VAGRVLITRPEPGAARTAKRVEGLGFEPVRLPLTEICPLSAGLPAGGVFDAVAASSANAIRHADQSLLRAVAELPVFAVGQGTADAADRAGLTNIIAGPGDAGDLARLMKRQMGRGSRVLYLCGRVRMETFEATLSDAGMEVMPVEIYDTSTVDYTDDELKAMLGKEPFENVLLYSHMAAGAFGKLTDRSVVSLLFLRSRLVCMSGRVAKPLVSLDGVRVAAHPNEEAMLALLGR